MKEEQKVLFIVPYQTANNNLTTAKIIYNNYEIGTCQFNAGFPLPSMGEIGSSYNSEYSYTLIFNNKNSEPVESLNISLNSISTNGFYQLNEGIFVETSNLSVPIGMYKNIGLSPEGIRYNLELVTSAIESKIILSRIC
jgi:hypothetical protein